MDTDNLLSLIPASIAEWNVYMRQLGEFYFSELDLERLRKEIRRFAEEFGISLD